MGLEVSATHSFSGPSCRCQARALVLRGVPAAGAQRFPGPLHPHSPSPGKLLAWRGSGCAGDTVGSARRVAPRLMAGGGGRGDGIAGWGGVSPPGRTLPLAPAPSRCDWLGSQGCGAGTGGVKVPAGLVKSQRAVGWDYNASPRTGLISRVLAVKCRAVPSKEQLRVGTRDQAQT